MCRSSLEPARAQSREHEPTRAELRAQTAREPDTSLELKGAHEPDPELKSSASSQGSYKLFD